MGTWQHNPIAATLDGDVMSIDEMALTSATKQLWAKPKDLTLCNLDRQSYKGTHNCSTANPFNLEPCLHNNVKIRTGDTLNPDLDIAAPGEHVIRADPRPPPLHESGTNEDDQRAPLLVVYEPDGKAAGTITKDRLLILYKSFQQAMGDQTSPPHDAFPMAVANLMSRYKEGRETENYCIKMKNYWTIPEHLMTAITSGFAVATERFASPLNFNAEMARYFTPFKEDKAFGALHDAYSCKWLGASHAHPENTAGDMQKAVRWALASAEQSDMPSLTVFTLSFFEKSNTAYQQFLEHPMTHKVAKIPRQAIQMQRPTAWSDGKYSTEHPRQDILLFIVANTLGIQEYLNGMQLGRGLQEIMAQTGKTFDFTIPAAHHNPDQKVYPPRGFEAATTPESLPEPAALDAYAVQAVNLPDSYMQQVSTLWPRNEIIYTDGSARDTGHPDRYRSGTGVFRFASTAGPALELRIDPIDYHTGVANTIQRAELVGIFKALQVDHDSPEMIICTDSLASMYMIDKHMRCPSLHKECKHEELLSLIVKELARKARDGVKVQLLKVKSHIGIEGNEKADKLAHEACRPRECSDSAREGVEIREDIYWPHFLGRKIHNAAGGAAAIVMNGQGKDQVSQADPARQDDLGKFQVNDLRKGLKTLLKPSCSMGFSNKTIYVLAWMAAMPYILGDISNHFWTNPQITASMVTMILKYRYGQLWNMKIAFRQQRPYLPGLRIPRSDKCPHCGQADSGGHILGGCKLPVFKAMYIARHDQALRMILQSIVKGDHGGYYIIADIGRADLTEHMGVSAKRIPAWLLPDSCLARANIDPADRSRVRPDILLVEMTQSECANYKRGDHRHPELSTIMSHQTTSRTNGSAGPQRRKVWLIEGGYTSDTRHLEKLAEKKDQHCSLMNALEDRGLDARLMIFTFGVGGTVYKQSKEDMSQLGVDAAGITKTLKEIHLHSVTTAVAIITQRRILDRQKLFHSHKQPP